MADGQEVQGVLDPVKAPDAVKAAAWDAYHGATDQTDFTKRFKSVNLPDEVKANLYDMKFSQPKEVSEAAKQPGAMQKKKGSPVFNAGSSAEQEFVRNPKAADTFENEPKDQPGLLDSLTQPQPGNPAWVRAMKGPLRTIRGMVETPFKLFAPPQNPEEAAIAGGTTPIGPGGGAGALAVKRGLIDPAIAAGTKAKESFSNIGKMPDLQSKALQASAGVLHGINAALPVVGPMSEGAFQSASSGDTAGAITEGATNVAMLRGGAKKAGEVGSRVSTKAGEVIDRPAPPESAVVGREALANTNKEVLQHAADNGIQLTPEQRTGEITGKQGMAEQAKFGGQELKQATADNRAKLGASINDFAERLDPQRRGLSEGSAGDALQADVKAMKDVTHENAANAYKQLPWTQNAAVSPAPITAAWMKWRGKLPMGVEDQIMANVPRELAAPVQEMLSPTGMKNPIPFDQAIQLRSLFRDLGSTEGAALPGKTQAAFKSLAEAADGSMEATAKGVGTKELGDWRKANAGWKDYNQKFGDPQSPLYKILNTRDPVKATRNFLNTASEGDVATLKDAVSKTVPKGQAQAAIDAALAPLRRQVIQDVANNGFKVGRDGLGGYSHAFLNQLFDAGPLKELYLKSELGRRLGFDVNPSRTAKVSSAAEQQFNPLEPRKSIGAMAKYSLAAKRNMPTDVGKFLNQPPTRLGMLPPLMAGATLPALQQSGNRGLLTQ